VSASAYPLNTYYNTTKPTGTFVYVRPNAYEAGRREHHGVQLGPDRDRSRRHQQHPGGGKRVRSSERPGLLRAPVLTGVYGGAQITLPMTGLDCRGADRSTAPSGTGPDFNVFVLRTNGGIPHRPDGAFTFSPRPPRRARPSSSPTRPREARQAGSGISATARDRRYAIRHMRSRSRVPILSDSPRRTRRIESGHSNRDGTARRCRRPPQGTTLLAPCRLLDTRTRMDRRSPALPAGGGRSSPWSDCADSRRYAFDLVNVTAYRRRRRVSLKRTREISRRRNLGSELQASKTIASAAIVTLATDGTGTMMLQNQSSGSVNVVLDVNGYFK